MSNPLGVYEALEAWQAGEITFKRAMRLTGARDVMELVAAARSSGVEILGLSERDRALLDRAARYVGNRMDTIAFWQRADEREIGLAMMRHRASRGDPTAALAILESIPTEPSQAGDEMPDDT